eukprot:CAMPEP_0185855894 /NCGR_PEP_ID=MMETSP1354-20130828/27151_1 /TAXON_ID=708628 /ORGANISM="Erythrolobus madagascarensis, Strain CCMP3276" /LENGTH=138 /DNA_ID=CAMNT_0028558011 /DNA_START=364 /DNA_END=780 /DNA_ORIENTATION=+
MRSPSSSHMKQIVSGSAAILGWGFLAGFGGALDELFSFSDLVRLVLGSFRTGALGAAVVDGPATGFFTAFESGSGFRRFLAAAGGDRDGELRLRAGGDAELRGAGEARFPRYPLQFCEPQRQRFMDTTSSSDLMQVKL